MMPESKVVSWQKKMTNRERHGEDAYVTAPIAPTEEEREPKT